MSQRTFNEIPPILSPNEPHMALLFLLDVSGSMIENGAINSLNASVNKFKEQVCADSRTTEILDVAIVTFNHETQVVMPFTPVAYMEPVNLVAGGGTEMASAVQMALNMVDERVQCYRHVGSEPYRPWIFMISDGYGGDISAVSELVRQKERDGHLKFFSLCVEGYDSKALHQLSGDKVLQLDGYDFSGFFDWISWGRQAPRYPHEPGEKPQLPRLPDNISLDSSDWWLD